MPLLNHDYNYKISYDAYGQPYYTGTSTTNNTLYFTNYPIGANPSAPPPAPVDKSPEEYQWLRQRVREITDLAPKL